MTTARMFCQIRVKGHLSDQWADWFGGLQIDNQPGGEALFSGTLPDQAALYGVLKRMHDLGLAFLSVNCVASSPEDSSHPCPTKNRNEKPLRGDEVRHGSPGKQA